MKRVILLFILLLVGCATRNEDLYSDTKIQVLLQVSEFADQNVQNGIKMSRNLVNGQNRISQSDVKSNNDTKNLTKSTYNLKVGDFAEVSKNGQKIKLSENGIQNSAQNFTENSVGTSAETKTKNTGTTRTLSDDLDVIDDVVFYVFDERGVQHTKSVFSSREGCSVEITSNGRYNIYVMCNVSGLVDLPETMSEAEIKELTIPHQESYKRLPFAGMTTVEVTSGAIPEVHIMLNRVNSAIKFENNSATRIDLDRVTVSGLPSKGYLFKQGEAAYGVEYNNTAEAVKDADGNMIVYSFYVPESEAANVEMEVEATVTGGTSSSLGGGNTTTTVETMNFVEQLETGKMATAYVGYLESGGLKVGSPDNWGNVGSYDLNGDVKVQVIGGTFTDDGDLRAYSGGCEFSFVISTNNGIGELINTASADWIEIRDNVIIVQKNTTTSQRSTQIAVKIGQTNVGVFDIIQGKTITFTPVGSTSLVDGYVRLVGGAGSSTQYSVRYDADDIEMNDIVITPTGDVASNADGIVIDIDRSAKTITATFMETVDASAMVESGIEVPVAFVDPNGGVNATVTFAQRPAKITFDPARLSNVDFRESDVEATVTTEGDATWAVYGNITEADGGTASWVTKTSPALTGNNGTKLKLHVSANGSSTGRTAYVRVKSSNTISKPLEVAQLPSYGIGTISASECWSSADNTLQAYSVQKTYNFTFVTQTAIPEGTALTVNCSKGTAADSGITASDITDASGENAHTFTLTVPASDKDTENEYEIDIEANGVSIGSFTVKTPVQPKFTDTNAEIWGGVKDRQNLKSVSYYASDWDLKDFESSNPKITVTKDVGGKILIGYAETMIHNDPEQSTTITMNLNGGNSVSFDTKQAPVTFDISAEDTLKFKDVVKEGGTIPVTVRTTAGTGSASWKVAKSTQTWLTTNPVVGGTETNASGSPLQVIVAANTGNDRTAQFVLESQNTTSPSYTVTQLANFTATIQSVTYGAGSTAVFESDVLKAYSVAYDYTFTIKTSIPITLDRIKLVSKTSGTSVSIKTPVAGSGDTYTFTLSVPANIDTKEIDSEFDIMVDDVLSGHFTVRQAKKTSILVNGKSANDVVGAPTGNEDKGTFVASSWDILSTGYVTSSNTTNHAILSPSVTGTFTVNFASSLTQDFTKTSADIKLMGADGQVRATSTVSQDKVLFNFSQDSCLFIFNAVNESQLVTITSPNVENMTTNITLSHSNEKWLSTSVSGNVVTVQILQENGETFRSTTFTAVYKGTTSQPFKVTQNPNGYGTVTIGTTEWTLFNLANSRFDSGEATFATKLPSQCTGTRAESHGKFYQWDRGNKSWASTGSISGWNSSGSSSTSWLADNDPCPEGYRVPTKDEFVELNSNSNVTDMSGSWSTSNYGYITFTSKTSSSVVIEFPAVGDRTSVGSLYLIGTHGYYWSSTQYSSSHGYAMYFNNGDVRPSDNGKKAAGFSVRCVRN